MGKYIFVGFYANRLLVNKLLQHAREIKNL